jgi:hypothetical protein
VLCQEFGIFLQEDNADLSKNFPHKLHFELEVYTSRQPPSLRNRWS